LRPLSLAMCPFSLGRAHSQFDISEVKTSSGGKSTSEYRQVLWTSTWQCDRSCSIAATIDLISGVDTEDVIRNAKFPLIYFRNWELGTKKLLKFNRNR
jgi:hypothetical protein